MKNIILVVIFTTLFISCSDENVSPKLDFSSNKKAASLIEADNKFAVDFFTEIYNTEENTNYMVSPLSVAIALGMAYNGSDGDTKSAFEETLRLSGMSSHEINEIHGALISHLLTVDPDVKFEIANSVWVNDIFTLMQEFADTSRYYYDAEINTLDFGDPDSKTTINNWVSEKTHEKIKTILDELNPDAVLYLINALYFNGTWTYEFDPENNHPINFQTSGGEDIQVDGMKQQEEFNFFSNDDFEMAELPYGSGKYCMDILLPSSEYKLDGLLSDFSFTNWKDWTSKMEKTELVVHIPKFKTEYKSKLNRVLSDLGMGVAFTNTADFSLLVEETNDILISEVIHKTFIDVNEEGTEAAAVTAVQFETISVGGGSESVRHFIANRPFIYIIREKSSGAIAFMGKIGSPEYE